jgi:hypothetical protein
MIKKWNNFILESNFLKGINYIGFVDLKLYDKNKILKVLEKYKSDDYLTEGDNLIYDFDNKELEDELNIITFVEETNNKFNTNYLSSATRTPIELDNFNFKDFIDLRLNHYLIKLNNSEDLVFGEIKSNSIKDFVNYCIEKAKELGLDYIGRYCYLTIDQKEIEPGSTQREAGWHIDGMQGTEVPEKENADYQFIWADETPTKFCTQVFDVSDMDPSIHNVFNYLGKQVKESWCYLLEKNRIYLMNAYHLHQATPTNKKVYRRFVRLSFTSTPITSVKMIVNPDIEYNYKIHQTTGNIPKNLI